MQLRIELKDFQTKDWIRERSLEYWIELYEEWQELNRELETQEIAQDQIETEEVVEAQKPPDEYLEKEDGIKAKELE